MASIVAIRAALSNETICTTSNRAVRIKMRIEHTTDWLSTTTLATRPASSPHHTCFTPSVCHVFHSILATAPSALLRCCLFWFAPFLFRIHCRPRTPDCRPRSLRILRTASFSRHTCRSAARHCAVNMDCWQNVQPSANLCGLVLREAGSHCINGSNGHSPPASRANHVPVSMSVTQKSENFSVVTTTTKPTEDITSVTVHNEDITCFRCGGTPCYWMQIDLAVVNRVSMAWSGQSSGYGANNEMWKLAFKTYIYERYGLLGKVVRIKLPHCALEGIRRCWPDESRSYMGVKSQ